jgi:hypothetical protein
LRRDTDRGLWSLTIVRDGHASKAFRVGVVEGGDNFYGNTSGGAATLLGANLASTSETSRMSGGEHVRHAAETWHGFRIVIGGHVDEDTKWESISLPLPLAWHWFSPTALEPRDEPVLSDELNDSLVCTVGEVSLSLWRHSIHSVGTQRTALEGAAEYVFAHPDGISTRDVEQASLALGNLHQVLFGEPTRARGLKLHGPMGQEFSSTSVEVPGQMATDSTGGFVDPYVSTREVAFETFVPNWIALHVGAPLWPVVGPPEGSGGWLHTQVLEAIAAVESLARIRLEVPNRRSDMQDEIRKAVSSLDSRTRKYVDRLLRYDGPSLAERLCQVSMLTGVASAGWLLGDRVRDWAEVVAKVRNLLAHGTQSATAIEQEPAVLVAVLQSVRVVYQLGLLRLAGFDNGQAGDSVELLVDAGGVSQIRHPNSKLAHDIKWVQRLHGEWRGWLKELTAT